MVQAWYYNDDGTDQRSPHQHNPVQLIDLEKLKQKTGVLYWKINADNYESEGKLKQIREERGYTYTDLIECCPEKLENYEDKLKNFFLEHLHADEEIRFVLEGSGYFDCRDIDDQWVRIQVSKGDLIVLPAGIYHRFTLDEQNYIKAMRLFVGEPVWTPINRPADDHPARKTYIEMANTSFQQEIKQSA